MRNLIALATLLLVLLLALVATERTSPGPLAVVHSRDDRIAGKDGCAVCHGHGEEDMTASCLACHGAIAEQLESGGGLHGGLDGALADDCARCHGEHLGESFALVGARSFEVAGADADGFDHRPLAGLDWSLLGRHAELACEACHPNAHVQPLPAGEPRFLGLDQTCATCHEDPHTGSYGEGCAECHGQAAPFERVAEFDHDPDWPLIGAHAETACVRCHEPGSAHAIEDLLDGPAARAVPPRESCRDCHADPHRAEFLAGASRELETAEGRSCVRCHRAEHRTFRGTATGMPAALHATTGFPLDAPHAGLECTDCHAEFGAETGGDARFARAFPGRGRRECEACHADPHAGQFDRGSAGTRCIECHRDDAFVPSGFDRARHGTTRFPLEAAHAAVACADCHGDAPDQRFAGTPLACAACHDDPHAGQFADGRHGASCLACHGPDAFVPSRFDVARHERTRFALTGAHAAVGCAACHGSGSAPGLTPVYADAPRECADCHDDPHGGRFDREGLPRVVGDRAGCARCHTTESFRLSADDVAGAADAFDHGRWTGYELVGAHAAAACADCHVPGPAGAALGRTLGPVSGTHCADCHVDPHLGQFDARGGTDCARCHAPASADFSATRFDHAHDARFAPGERHRDVACASCHQAYDLSGGSTVVRYRPLGTRCADCHEPGSVDE